MYEFSMALQQPQESNSNNESRAKCRGRLALAICDWRIAIAATDRGTKEERSQLSCTHKREDRGKSIRASRISDQIRAVCDSR